MDDFYLEIRQVHIGAVIVSGVLMLLFYIVLGYVALRGASARLRWASLGGAALVYGFIISIARAHNQLGVFA